jgi:hypothetical protein
MNLQLEQLQQLVSKLELMQILPKGFWVIHPQPLEQFIHHH